MSFDINKPFTTWDGRKARLVGKVSNPQYPFAVAVMEPNGEELLQSYTADGRFYYFESDIDKQNDLKNVNVLYVNVYPGSGSAFPYETLEKAHFCLSPNEGFTIEVSSDGTVSVKNKE